MITRSSRGFTLIELLVVIAIIGILSSVVLASLNSARAKGRDARRISDLKQLQLALELYYDANSGAYPIVATAAAISESNAMGDLTPSFISVLPTDPSGSQSYYYYSANGSTYCLGANLEATSNLPASSCSTAGGGSDYQVGP